MKKAIGKILAVSFGVLLALTLVSWLAYGVIQIIVAVEVFSGSNAEVILLVREIVFYTALVLFALTALIGVILLIGEKKHFLE